MNLPTLETMGNNAHALTLTFPKGPTLKLWYSYQTCVAFAFNGQRTVRQNEWRQTTGRHLSAIDGGDKRAKAARIPGDVFEIRLAEALETLASADGFAKKCRRLGERALCEMRERYLFNGRTDRLAAGLARDGMLALVAEARRMDLGPSTVGPIAEET